MTNFQSYIKGHGNTFELYPATLSGKTLTGWLYFCQNGSTTYLLSKTKSYCYQKSNDDLINFFDNKQKKEQIMRKQFYTKHHLFFKISLLGLKKGQYFFVLFRLSYEVSFFFRKINFHVSSMIFAKYYISLRNPFQQFNLRINILDVP